MITGRLYKYEEHLQTEIEIHTFLHREGCPMYKYYSSTKMKLYEVLVEADVDVDTYFMVKIKGVLRSVNGHDKLDIKLDDVKYMYWDFKEEVK